MTAVAAEAPVANHGRAVGVAFIGHVAWRGRVGRDVERCGPGVGRQRKRGVIGHGAGQVIQTG